MEDELRDEYDLKSLKIRKMGAKRTSFGNTIIKLDSDVAELFPNYFLILNLLMKLYDF